MQFVGNDRVIAGWTAAKGAQKDGWLYRMSNAGFKVWEFSYGKGSEEAFEAVTAVTGGAIAAGWSSFSPTDKLDVFVVPVNDKGNVNWERRLGSDADDYAKSVAIVDVGIIVAGARAMTSKTVSKASLWRLEFNGNLAWQRDFNATGHVVWDQVTPLSDGLLIGGFRAYGDDMGLRLARTDAFGITSCADSGQCAGKKGSDCDDGKPCTADSCGPSKGCEHDAYKPGAPCGAGKICSKAAICQ